MPFPKDELSSLSSLLSVEFSSPDQLPDVYTLFTFYNEKYFERRLESTIVEWSDRMTSCAGICYLRRERGIRYCIIRLSRPLLQYRPFLDIISTLLHEMIHAYLWMTSGNNSSLNRDGHGPDFIALANIINKAEGSQVTIFHSFYKEVEATRKHIWSCNGPCRWKPPFFGIVRRAMNRPPQLADWWWKDHLNTCGGTFSKVSGPNFNIKANDDSSKFNVDNVPNNTNHQISNLHHHPFTLQRPTSQESIQGYKSTIKVIPKSKLQGERSIPSAGKTILDYWTREQPKFAREREDLITMKCPVCFDYKSNDQNDLNNHIDKCLDGKDRDNHSTTSSDGTCPSLGKISNSTKAAPSSPMIIIDLT